MEKEKPIQLFIGQRLRQRYELLSKMRYCKKMKEW